MTADSIFAAALAIVSPVERAAYLDEACAGDPALRVEIEALLRAHDEAGNALREPPATPGERATPPPAVPSPVVEGPGSRVGPYKLLQQIGEGGMGVVYLAEQDEPVRRRVALKIIKPGMDTKQVIARFEVERQALALMDHPNIAKVLDGGTTDPPPAPAPGAEGLGERSHGSPFFVMELVKGVPLTRYCDDARLSVRQRLEIFIQVCQAVQHAHQKGIIHRDLKPSNVLVSLYDGRPVPKVIDFGVAKATGPKLTERTLFTALGAVVGTLEYMAPEQAEVNQLDVDTRTDIYSLGVLLYEQLTGTTPLERGRLTKAALWDALRLIREEEPPRPSARLSSSATLARVAASRATEPAKLTKLLRGELDWIVMKCLEKDRNRRYETANGLARDPQRYLADEPVLAQPPSAMYLLRKFARRHKAGLAVTATAALALAVAAIGVGWALWDRAAQAEARAERMAETDKAVTEALARAEELAMQAQGMPLATSQQAREAGDGWRRAEDALAPAAAALRTGEAADNLRRRVVDLRAHLQQGRDKADQRRGQAERREKLLRDLDDARMASATWVENYFDVAGAAAKYAAAFTAYGIEVRPGQTAAFAQRIHAEKPALQDALLVALDDWAFCAARAPMRWAAPDLRALAQAADRDAWRQEYRKAVLDQDGGVLVRLSIAARELSLPPTSLDQLARALRDGDFHQEAVDLLRWARGRHPTDFWIPFHLGSYLGQAKDSGAVYIEERIGCFRVAVALRPDSGIAHTNLGFALNTKGDLNGAIAEYRKAIEIDPKFAGAHANLGSALQGKGDLDGAIAANRKAIELEPKFAPAHTFLGNALMAKGDLDGAIVEHRKAIEIDPKFAGAHYNLGYALQAKGDLDGAIAEHRNAIAIDPKFAWAHYNLGYALQAKGDLDGAIAEYRKAIALDPKEAKAHTNLGLAVKAKGDLDGAISEYRRAIALNAKLAEPRNNLGAALQAKGDLDGAIVEHRKAIEIDPKFAGAHFNLGKALQAKGDRDGAVAEYREAIALKSDYAEAHCGLGAVLKAQGRLVEALASYRRGHELGSKQPAWRYPSAQWVREAERLVALEGKLIAVLEGNALPKDNDERLGLGLVCRLKRQYHAAARLYADAFAADLKAADNPKTGHRYNAACAAGLAAAGQGTNAGKLDAQERTWLRRQALAWLRADLLLWQTRLEGAKPEDRALVQKTLRHWQRDSDLAGLRDADAVAHLPAEERETCRTLWADVAEVLKKAGASK
jgi:serine/threonine protein kinase/tetratricopeptide (TPR) repeat protein